MHEAPPPPPQHTHCIESPIAVPGLLFSIAMGEFYFHYTSIAPLNSYNYIDELICRLYDFFENVFFKIADIFIAYVNHSLRLFAAYCKPTAMFIYIAISVDL